MRSEMSMIAVERRWSGWLALLLFLGICLALVPSAAADSYHDFLCRVPYGPSAGRPAPTDDVTYTTINGPYLSAGESCPSHGSMFAAMDGETTHPFSARAMDTFEAPTGLSIAGFTVWRYEAAGPSQVDGTAESKLQYIPGPPSVDALCDYGCSLGRQAEPLSSENEVSVVGLSGVSEIQWSAGCGGGPGGTCPESGSGTLSAQYDVYAADIDLVDNTPPTVSGVGGPLVAGGTLTGTQSVSFDAADGQSGVYGGSLVVDGKTVVSQVLNTNEGHCQSLGVTNDGQRSFEHALPCLPSLSASLTLNTSQLAAGEHSLELIVEDAAGNKTIGYNGTITTSGPPSSPNDPAGTHTAIGPGSPLALRGPANGVSASDQATLTARWKNMAKEVRMSGYGTKEEITGRLTAPGGLPISGASLGVYETPAYEGARTVPLTGVRTGPTGAWTLTLPRDVSSSALRFEYRSHENDTVPVATVALTLRVHAGIKLKIAPHTTSVGHTIVFTGTLRGAPIPPGGKQLVLEASSGEEWIQFDTITTNAKGHYRASYRFKFPGPASYRFRVYVPHEADFPFLGGTSNVVGVYER
jgi:hypothetical protein